MGLVDVLVDYWQVQPSVNPVDAVVGEQQEPITLFSDHGASRKE
jgi:hypothetical protein